MVPTYVQSIDHIEVLTEQIWHRNHRGLALGSTRAKNQELCKESREQTWYVRRQRKRGCVTAVNPGCTRPEAGPSATPAARAGQEPILYEKTTFLAMKCTTRILGYY